MWYIILSSSWLCYSNFYCTGEITARIQWSAQRKNSIFIWEKWCFCGRCSSWRSLLNDEGTQYTVVSNSTEGSFNRIFWQQQPSISNHAMASPNNSVVSSSQAEQVEPTRSSCRNLEAAIWRTLRDYTYCVPPKAGCWITVSEGFTMSTLEDWEKFVTITFDEMKIREGLNCETFTNCDYLPEVQLLVAHSMCSHVQCTFRWQPQDSWLAQLLVGSTWLQPEMKTPPNYLGMPSHGSSMDASCCCCQKMRLKDPSVLLETTVVLCSFIIEQRSSWRASSTKTPFFSDKDAIFSLSTSLDARSDFTCAIKITVT